MGFGSAAMAGEPQRIVLSNDDGLTANLVALHAALTDAGHDVIVSVPCQNQSGMSGALRILEALPTLSEECLNAAAPVGAPSAGVMTLEGLPAQDFFYVDGTPVMALMYGLDVVAEARWGAAPDLVLSGPNEGQNVGAVTLNSGTVANAQHAAMRGLPAIALSAGSTTAGEPLAPGEASTEVAARSTDLVGALAKLADGSALLPDGVALNVNFPNDLDDPAWRATQIGTYNAYVVRFFESVSKNPTKLMDALAAAEGIEFPDHPGIVFDFNTATPSPAQQNDESVVFHEAIAISPMQAGYALSETSGYNLSALVEKLSETSNAD